MTDADTQDAPRVRTREIALFVVFGLLPFAAIYLFAAAAGDDPYGRAFEVERRALLSACADQERDRDRCREAIDAAILPCFKRFADPSGALADRTGFAACVERGPADAPTAP